jgi:hypothetical protein
LNTTSHRSPGAFKEVLAHTILAGYRRVARSTKAKFRQKYLLGVSVLKFCLIFETGLELIILLPQAPECWDQRYSTPHLAGLRFYPLDFHISRVTIQLNPLSTVFQSLEKHFPDIQLCSGYRPRLKGTWRCLSCIPIEWGRGDLKPNTYNLSSRKRWKKLGEPKR